MKEIERKKCCFDENRIVNFKKEEKFVIFISNKYLFLILSHQG